MKMYTIKKGTEGIALKDWMETAVDGELKSKKHVTTQELEFFDTLHDPVRAANGGGTEIPLLDSLAAIGYAIFCDHNAPRYALAVLYKDVKVS